LKVTLNWLKEFLETSELDVKEIAGLLTMSGSEVKKIEDIGSRYENIIVGEVKEFHQHPNADKLSVCRVDIGTKITDIVCGAKNFKNGDRVAVALPGSVIKGTLMRESKIRGEVSYGMMCSEMELELSQESEGIMILENSCRVGESFAKSTGLDDFVFELEITPNRPDCLSVIGIAREISALNSLGFKIPDYDFRERLNTEPEFTIEIKDKTLCPRYSARIFKDIPDVESPQWIKNRLMMCDVRPVNLIVDLTNYVMLETGQPLHAFDKDLLYSSRIIVRRASKEEKIKTIDDSLRILGSDDLVIADEKKAVAIAGIMGGIETEIGQETRSVLLEAANFDGSSIMRTSKKLGLRSEASNRFEKKIDPTLTLFAIGRFEDILKIATGFEKDGCIYDEFDKKERTRNISLRVKEAGNILGKSIKKEEMSDILTRLKIANIIKRDTIDASIPSFRYEDLEREIDLIEEVARIYGYDKLDSIPIRSGDKRGKYTHYQKKIREIRQALCDIGLNEVINYSFINEREIKRYGFNNKKYGEIVEILNPINEDFKFLRTALLPAMMENIKDNINHNIKDIRIFEISKVFRKKEGGELPLEINKLGIALTGKASKKSWDGPERNVDFYDLKGIMEFLKGIYYKENEMSIEESRFEFLHPRISGKINIDGKVMGVIGKVHPLIVVDMEIDQDIYYMELNLDDFINSMKEIFSYKAIPIFPSIDIDIAVVVDEKVKSWEVVKEIKESGSELLKKVRLFDIYRGEQIDRNKKSMAYSLSFRDDLRTLKDAEVEIIKRRILENLGRKLNAAIRE
jgi:phenylalanyl-tRNA synthetase beta chain